MAGFKVWVPGERVGYVDLNDYIQEQVIPQFASTAARDSAITAPVEGMVCVVTGSVDRFYTYTGAAWEPSGWYSSNGRVGVDLRRASAQTIGASTQATITWDTEDQDTDGFIAVSGTTITIPAGCGGLYAVNVRMQASSTVTTGAVYLTIGGEVYGQEWIAAGSYGTVGTGAVRILATTTLSVQVFNGTGSSRDFTGRWTCYRIGP